ncbi:MAG: hypothetical protein ACK5JN_06245 [Kluyvera sp.]|uniref:hypothetical protein n=1 Tax=Kluyvera sp. TaxID=1538228 RepID=UPI003A858898
MSCINSDDVVTIVSPETHEELLAILEFRWPEHRIPAAEFLDMLGDATPLMRRVLIFHAGSGRTWYNTREVADLLWGLTDEDECDTS